MNIPWKKKPFIYMPKKKVIEQGGGGTITVSSVGIMRNCYQLHSDSRCQLSILEVNPRAFNPSWTLRTKRMFSAVDSSSGRQIILRLAAYNGYDFVSVANACEWMSSIFFSDWSVTYCWYVKSGDSKVYHIKNGNSYQVGTVITTDNSDYRTRVSYTPPISTIQNSQAFRDVANAGSLIFSDYNMTQQEILPYINALGYGNKTSVVDLDIS